MASNDTDRAADQAAELAVALVALSHLREVRGRPLTAAQRAMQARAARLARHLDRTQRRKKQR